MRPLHSGRRGFTLVELIIALVVGLTVVGAALSFAMMTWRVVEANTLRGDVYRNVRFMGMVFERDFAFTGVGIASTPSWGTLSVGGDTIMLLSVPYEPNEAPPYSIDPPLGTNNPLDPGGTCGPQCIDLKKDANGQFTLKAGDFARLQVADTRRVILVGAVTVNASGAQLYWTPHTEILRYAAGLAGDLRLDRFNTFVQKLAPVVYYLDGERLMRAQGFDPSSGKPRGEVIASGVKSWEVRVIFVDGTEADRVDTSDANPNNDYDDILGVRISAELVAERAARRLGGAQQGPFTRNYEWTFAPRNLTYERNRI